MPIFLRKEFLTQIGCVLDMSDDRLYVSGRWFLLEEIGKGHYCCDAVDQRNDMESTKFVENEFGKNQSALGDCP